VARVIVLWLLLLSITAWAQSDLDSQARSIGATLKCPVCNGLPLTESPSEFAKSMYAEVRSQVGQGRTGQEIKAFFVEKYGPSVLLEPPFSGVTLLVWLLPLAALALGAWGLFGYLHRAARPQTLEPVDAGLLERVRELRNGS
jgi:cytochrome c-type biogenesis protein CcmH